jgi:hypothetical protein
MVDPSTIGSRSLAGDVGPAGLAPLARDLVDLVDEDDAVVLHPVERLVHHVVHVHQLLELLVHQHPPRLGHLHRAPLLPPRQHVLQHLGEVDVGPLHALGRLDELHHGEALRGDLDLDLAVVEDAVEQHLPELLPRAAPALLLRGRGLLRLRLAGGADHEHGASFRRRRCRALARRDGCRRGRKQEVEQPLVRPLLRLGEDLVLPLGAHHVDGGIHQVAHHGLRVAPDVAHLGELGRLHLDEGRAGEPRQPARDFRLPHPGGADHDDVVGGDLVPDVVGRLRAAPAVPHRDGNGLLGGVLPDDVAVELGDDLPGRHLLQPGRRRCLGFGLGDGADGGVGHGLTA